MRTHRACRSRSVLLLTGLRLSPGQKRPRLSTLVIIALASLATVLVATAPTGAQGKALSSEPQWGANLQVTDPPLDPQTRHMNYSVAINPANSSTVLSSYDYQDPAALSTIGYALSTDAGRSWRNQLFTGEWGKGLSPEMNSSVVFDAHGVAYLSGRTTSNTMTGYFVLTSTQGVNWNTPIPVIVTTYAQYRDQASLAVDRRKTGLNAGSLYFVYRYFTLSEQAVHIKYSRDGGSTWASEIRISDPQNGNDFGPTCLVASDGTLYVAFMQILDSCFRCGYEPTLFVDRSTDGGRTWGQDKAVTGATIVHAGALDVKQREWILPADNSGGDVRIYHNPSLAIAPNDSNTLYIAWNDGRWDSEFVYGINPGKHSDIAFSRSTDAGQTWSAPIRVNDDSVGNGVDQWQPNLAVRPDGPRAIPWYDRRYSFFRPGYISGYYYDFMYSQSTDGGRTWSPSRRISEVSSNAVATTDYKSVGDLGARNPLVFGPDYALATWADGRRGNALELYVDRGPFGPGTANPWSGLRK